MVAYGVPVIHQSLATAPLDIKEAIDWLIRIGGKDVKDEATKCSELMQVLEATVKAECKVAREAMSVSNLEANLKTFVDLLDRFVGHTDSSDNYGRKAIGSNGIARRGGHNILTEISTGRFLMCCKNDMACTAECKCCQGDKSTGGICSPHSCPIKKVLECSITLIGMCGDQRTRTTADSGSSAYVCCILSFLITCFEEGKVLNHSPVQCQRCDGSNLHKECHKGCKCAHKKVISKVTCRLNCLIQLASTINTLYINRGVPMCLTCQHCNVCNPPGYSNKCQPCTECGDASQGNGKHCDLCRTGQCCEVNNARNKTCKSNCERCQNCSTVRNSKAFWDMLNHVSYTCGKCTECSWQKGKAERNDCKTCSVCQGESCTDGCKYRKRFGHLILELLHFMVHNFGDVAYALKGNINRLKDDCCNKRDKAKDGQCSEACCGRSTAGISVCEDCTSYCIGCADRQDEGSCNCANQCSEKLELILRPALSGYVSAYDYKTATWENLCTKANGDNKGKCSDQCTESCQCYSATCHPEGCCTYCPKRQCAKIFCMVIPAIYRSFDYINYQIDAELGDGGGNPTSQWASALIDGDLQLGDLFRTCGFQSNQLKPRMGCELMPSSHSTTNSACRSRDHKPGNLKELLMSCETLNKGIVQALQSCIINANVSMSYRKPETVREKLLWLCGLPYSDVYEDLQRTFVASMPNGRSSQHIMELTLRLGIFPFHILENSSQSVWHYVTQGCQVPNTKHSLYYNPDPTRLLWDLYDAMYDLTCALTFLNKQCGVSIQNCGWEECKFGKSVNLNGSSIDVCNCQMGKCNPTCYHCTDVCNACRGDAKCVCCCPHCEQRPDSCVCLVRFITSHGTLPDQEVVSRFSNARYGNMAFPRDSLRNMEMAGALLYDCMSSLLTRDHALYPRLLEDLLVARAGIPWNLSDYYALFLSLGRKLELESNQKGAPGKALTEVFKSTMRDTFFGAHEGNLEHVVIAVRHLYNQDQAMPAASSVHKNDFIHQASDIMSVNGCYHGKGCVGYMYALSSGMYERDSEHPYKGVSDSTQMFTKWIFFGATAFYNAMKHLTAEINTLECCNSSCYCRCNPGDSNTCVCSRCKCFCQEADGNCSCGTIIKCNNIHPLLYRYGFTLHEPDIWSYPKRRCQDFSDTLNRFIGPDSMLCRLIEAIENFLWHIRMPFCIALLTLWATALCFLMYVFIGHLDRLGIRSRWVLRTPIAHPLQLFTSSMVKPMGSGGGAVI